MYLEKRSTQSCSVPARASFKPLPNVFVFSSGSSGELMKLVFVGSASWLKDCEIESNFTLSITDKCNVNSGNSPVN